MGIRIVVESKNTDEELISAFSYNTGKLIEKLIKTETNNLKETNATLEAKILHFYISIKDPEEKQKYKEYFGISSQRFGNIETNES